MCQFDNGRSLVAYLLNSNSSLFMEKRLATMSSVNKLHGSTAYSSNLEVFTVVLSEVLSELLVPLVISSDWQEVKASAKTALE